MTILFAKKIKMIEPFNKAESSFHSTFDVHEDDMTSCMAAAEPVSPLVRDEAAISISAKRVSFDESANTCIGRTSSRPFASDTTPFSLDMCWYTPQEIQTMKRGNQELVHWILEEQQFGCTTPVYSLLSELYSSCKKHNKIQDLEQRLIECYSASDLLWGLESKAIFDIKKKSQQSKERLRSELRDIQLEAEFWDEEEQDLSQDLLEACLHCTQTASLFAQVLGRVQQQACH